MTPSAPPRQWVLLATLLLPSLLAWGGVLRLGFAWDDTTFIRDNPALSSLSNVPAFFLHSDAVGAGTNPYYRPLTTATFALDVHLFGDDPRGYHAVNLLLHLLAAAALLLAALRLPLRPAAAVGAALLFALHPAHAEPVAYISARADLLATLLVLASFLLYLRHAESGKGRELLLSAACHLAALFCKITAGVLPAILLLHMRLLPPGKARLRTLLPFGATTALYLAARFQARLLDRWWDTPLPVRLLNAGPIVAEHLRNALFPPALRAYYDLPYHGSPLEPRVVAGWGAVAVSVAGALWVRRRSPAASFGILWALLALLPVSGIVLALHHAHVADRYLYLPLAGLALAAGAAIQRLLPEGSPPPRAALAAGAAVALVLGLLSAGRVPLWKSDLAFWTAAAADAPENALARARLGEALAAAGRPADGEKEIRTALALGWNEADGLAAIARIDLVRGDGAAAERRAREALRLDPGGIDPLIVLGRSLAAQGRHEEAVHAFDRALRGRPADPTATGGIRRSLEALAGS